MHASRAPPPALPPPLPPPLQRALPPMYPPDCIRGTVELIEAPRNRLGSHVYNMTAMSFTPAQVGLVMGGGKGEAGDGAGTGLRSIVCLC